jgi:hypothetical protein
MSHSTGSGQDVIDNGRRVRLVIDGVFDGEAGLADGVLACIPNRKGKRARYARRAELDGRTVLLTFIGDKDGFASFRYAEDAA